MTTSFIQDDIKLKGYFCNVNLVNKLKCDRYGCSSKGRGLTLHARGIEFDTPHLPMFFESKVIYLIYLSKKLCRRNLYKTIHIK